MRGILHAFTFRSTENAAGAAIEDALQPEHAASSEFLPSAVGYANSAVLGKVMLRV